MGKKNKGTTECGISEPGFKDYPLYCSVMVQVWYWLSPSGTDPGSSCHLKFLYWSGATGICLEVLSCISHKIEDKKLTVCIRGSVAFEDLWRRLTCLYCFSQYSLEFSEEPQSYKHGLSEYSWPRLVDVYQTSFLLFLGTSRDHISQTALHFCVTILT